MIDNMDRKQAKYDVNENPVEIDLSDINADIMGRLRIIVRDVAFETFFTPRYGTDSLFVITNGYRKTG